MLVLHLIISIGIALFLYNTFEMVSCLWLGPRSLIFWYCLWSRSLKYGCQYS